MALGEYRRLFARVRRVSNDKLIRNAVDPANFPTADQGKSSWVKKTFVVGLVHKMKKGGLRGLLTTVSGGRTQMQPPNP